jgi:hypothetical protein
MRERPLAQAKREAQEALFAAIKDQAENNMKSALKAPEKAHLLLELAEAYRLTAGGSMPVSAAHNGQRENGAARQESSTR